MGKHDRKEEPRIIRLQDYREAQAGPGEEEAQAVIEYGGDKAGEGAAPGGKARHGAKSVPKAVYQVAVILLVLVVGLAVWMNRTNLSPENIGSWLKLQVMGSEAGDGFPVQITGSEVLEANFLAQGGNAVVLSDTAL